MSTEAGSDVAVVGCGAMGAGIAQLALLAGHRVLLRDLDPAVAASAREAVLAQVDRQVARGRVDPAAVPGLRSRLVVATEPHQLAAAAVVVEAVAESMAVKLAVLRGLEAVVAPGCILATNTSSLSVDEVAAGLERPERLVGMHFFNPAPVMQLVEVVRGARTAPAVVAAVADLATAWGRTPVVVGDSPGFVVNRVARAYYSESLRLLDEGSLDPATIDRLLRAAGFPMGPCELMDLIGHDVSLAATTAVWEATGHHPRYAPSPTQQELVAQGHLGRKTGRGFHLHPAPGGETPRPVGSAPPVTALAAGGDEVLLPLGARLRTTDGRSARAHSAETGAPVLLVDRWTPHPAPAVSPAVAVGVPEGCPAPVVQEALEVLRARGLDPVPLPDVPGLVVTRVVSLLVDEASEVVARGTATAADCDLALRLGARHPRGPLAWGDLWGAASVVAVLDHLRGAAGDPTYDPTYDAGERLRSRALTGRPLTDDGPG